MNASSPPGTSASGGLSLHRPPEATPSTMGRDTGKVSQPVAESATLAPVSLPPNLNPAETPFEEKDLSRPQPPTIVRSASAGTGAVPPDRQPMPQTIAGHEVLAVLGRGAMGVVYKARQRGLKRLVALKMILAGTHASSEEHHRFRVEAEVAAQLQHPNIVQIYEVGEEDGRPYFVLEYVDGESLARRINGTPQPPVQAAELVRLLALALSCAHERGIIHRDLKPANVLVTRDGVPKITDFGLAKRLREDGGQTLCGSILGTPGYMAPEQAEGRLAEVGPRSDVYSLGATLYEMLTGRPPFRGATLLETLFRVSTREPVAPTKLAPGVPRDLETICLKCLHKEPRKRYQSAGELAEDLRRFLAGEPILARPPGAGERLWRWLRRHQRVAALAAAMLALGSGWAATSSVLVSPGGVNEAEVREVPEAPRAAEEKAREPQTPARAGDRKGRALSPAARQRQEHFKEQLSQFAQQMKKLHTHRSNRQMGPWGRDAHAEPVETQRQRINGPCPGKKDGRYQHSRPGHRSSKNEPPAPTDGAGPKGPSAKVPEL